MKRLQSLVVFLALSVAVFFGIHTFSASYAQSSQSAPSLNPPPPLEQRLKPLLPVSPDEPPCYYEQPDGRLTDLTKLCDKSSSNLNSTHATTSPDNSEVIRKFDDELYGRDK